MTAVAGYRRVLTLPGARAFSLAGLVARLPMSMVSLGIVVLVSARTDTYTMAGTMSAAFVTANAAFATQQARLIDRLGQSRVLPVAAVAFSAGLAAMMAAVELGLQTPWPHLFAALAGAAVPQVGSSIRARWAHLVGGTSELNTAFALESMVDEVVFIVGPVLVTTLATAVHPLAGLTCAVIATLVGTFALVGQRPTEPAAAPHARRTDGPGMPWGVLAPLVVSSVAMGAVLGGAEVATVARSDELGAPSLAGLMLAIWAVGSLVSGALSGALPLRLPNDVRFRWGMLALGALMVPLFLVHGFLALGALLFLSGFAISPTLIAAFAWIEETVPEERITEGITLVTTGLGAGLAPGAVLVGLLTDRSGASTSYLVTALVGLAGAAVAFGARGVPRRTRETVPAPEPEPSLTTVR